MTTFRIVPIQSRALRTLTGVVLSAGLALGAAGCGSEGIDDADPSTTAGDPPAATAPATAETTASGVSVLSVEERDGLGYMVEEEKLAHDVYLVLGEQWDVPTFTNIVDAESTHMAAVRALLDRYGIADPTGGAGVGEFSDPSLAALYTELVDRGRASLTEALAVGAAIEELDIVDLEARLAQTDEPAIEAVYESLRSGSENHLRAFVRALDARGVTYSPVQLDQLTFDAVLAGSSGNGRGGA